MRGSASYPGEHRLRLTEVSLQGEKPVSQPANRGSAAKSVRSRAEPMERAASGGMTEDSRKNSTPVFGDASLVVAGP